MSVPLGGFEGAAHGLTARPRRCLRTGQPGRGDLLHSAGLGGCEDAEVAPDPLDVAASLERVPAVDRRPRPEHFEHVGEHRAEEGVRVLDVDLAVLVGPVLARVVGPLAGVIDEVGRIGCDERGCLARHDAVHVGELRAVAAEQAVVAEDPEVAGLRDRHGRRRLGTGVVEVRALLGSEAGDQPLDLLVVEAYAVERALFAKLFEQAGQRGVIPLGELVRLVVGDRVGDGVDVGAVEPPDRDLHQPELLRGLEARVAGDHLAGAARDDGLLPAEAAEGGSDVRDRGVVLTRVGRGAEELAGRDELDRRREGLRLRDSRRKIVSRLEFGTWSGCSASIKHTHARARCQLVKTWIQRIALAPRAPPG